MKLIPLIQSLRAAQLSRAFYIEWDKPVDQHITVCRCTLDRASITPLCPSDIYICCMYVSFCSLFLLLPFLDQTFIIVLCTTMYDLLNRSLFNLMSYT